MSMSFALSKISERSFTCKRGFCKRGCAIARFMGGFLRRFVRVNARFLLKVLVKGSAEVLRRFVGLVLGSGCGCVISWKRRLIDGADLPKSSSSYTRCGPYLSSKPDRWDGGIKNFPLSSPFLLPDVNKHAPLLSIILCQKEKGIICSPSRKIPYSLFSQDQQTCMFNFKGPWTMY